MPEVKNKRIEDGVYEFSLGDKTVRAVRQPDLYFVIELDGKQHKGYIKNLKETFAAWAQAGVPAEAPAAAQEEPARASRRSSPPGAPAGPIPGLHASLDPSIQRRIDRSETTEEAMKAWVAAYNDQPAGKRRAYLLPKGARILPPVKKCFDAENDIYTWPREHGQPIENILE